MKSCIYLTLLLLLFCGCQKSDRTEPFNPEKAAKVETGEYRMVEIGVIADSDLRSVAKYIHKLFEDNGIKGAAYGSTAYSIVVAPSHRLVAIRLLRADEYLAGRGVTIYEE